VAVGNGSTVGGGTELTPLAEPEDGKLDLMISFAVGPLSRFGYAVKLRAGRHQERPDVLYRRGSRVSVTGQPFYVSADGELYGPERTRTWHVEPGAFSMPLPPRGQGSTV
jgi:diacylglycerol kinase family enzyme